MADDSTGIHVISVAGTTLAEVGSFNTTGAARAVAVSGTTLYVADGLAGIYMLDAANLQNIQLIDSYDTEAYAKDIAVQNDLVTVADGIGGVVILQRNR